MNFRRSNVAGGWRWLSKTVFRIMLLLGIVCLFCVGVLQNETASKLNGTSVEGGRSRKNMVKVVEKNHLNAHKAVQVNFVSKRRVPNGPDPIHNRRAANSHRPPGRV